LFWYWPIISTLSVLLIFQSGFAAKDYLTKKEWILTLHLKFELLLDLCRLNALQIKIWHRKDTNAGHNHG
jgi:hypothetical protein